MAGGQGDKTEKASQRQKQKARERGDIFQSRELTGALGMAAGVLAMGTMTERFAIGGGSVYTSARHGDSPRYEHA